MYSRIVAPLDGSELAEIALPYMQELALRLNSEIDVVSVADPHGTLERPLKTYLDRIIKQLNVEGAMCRAVILRGNPAEAILDYVERNDIRLIVMSTHGQSGITRWALGNVTDKVLRGARIPILLLNSRAVSARETKLEKTIFKRILLPLDGSELGEAALPYVESLAAKMNSEIYLFQLIPPAQGVILPEGYALYGDRYISNAIAVAENYLKTIQEKLAKSKISASYFVEVGSPAEGIISFAKSKDIDLIAMSTHGRSGLSRWVFGSVAEKVIYAAEMPILVVRAVKKPG